LEGVYVVFLVGEEVVGCWWYRWVVVEVEEEVVEEEE
jgi:hypothetical protein